MRQIYTLHELVSMQSNAFRCVKCNKFWLDGQVFGFYASPGDGRPDCSHPKLVRTMVIQRQKEDPQAAYRRKKRRGR